MLRHCKYPSLKTMSQLDNMEKAVLEMMREDDMGMGSWLVEEKLDGCNIQLYIDAETWNIGSRNQMLGQKTTFYGLDKVLPDLQDMIVELRKMFIDEHITSVMLVGEFFGTGIMNRVFYGKPKIRFYDFAVFYDNITDDPDWWTHKMRHDAGLSYHGENDWHKFFDVPYTAFSTFDSALKFCLDTVEHTTTQFIAPEDVAKHKNDAHIEGYVISCRDCDSEPILLPRPRGLKIKVKAERFLEKSAQKKEIREKNTELKSYKEIVSLYCTFNRMLSVCSKMGKPNNASQAGEYIKAFIEDAREEFREENPEIWSVLDKNEIKQIFNFGSKPFEFFSSCMSE